MKPLPRLTGTPMPRRRYKAKPGKIDDLILAEDRSAAKLAAKARVDIRTGSALAAVIAKRMKATGSKLPVDQIVADVYTQTQDVPSDRWSPWECPECGGTFLGIDAALECCAELK